MNHARRILLTGWSGFLGGNVFRELCERLSGRDEVYCLGRTAPGEDIGLPSGATLRFLRADLTDAAGTAEAVAGIRRLTHVVHLAAVSTQDADPSLTLRTNLTGTVNLADCVGDYTHFTFASSAAVFGDKLAAAPREHEPHAPTTLYGETKSLAERFLGRRFRRLCVVRPVAQVGPGATHGLLRDVVAKLKSPAGELELRGDEPGSAKPFLYAPDTARAVVDLALGAAVGPYHLSPGEDDCVTVARVARLAMEELGVEKPVRWLGEGAVYRGDQKVVRLSPTKRPSLRFRPSEEAVRMAVRGEAEADEGGAE